MELSRCLIQKTIHKLALICLPVFAASFAFGVSASSYRDSFNQGLASYKKGEWNDATIYLRQSVSKAEYATDANWYMIIMSELYSGNYSAAINDCDYFMENFPDSVLLPNVEYQRGRAYHSAGLNDNSVMALSSFCNEHPDSEMYSSALFWIAECFYEDYDFDTARALYERIVNEFPASPKFSDAEFKLYLITQHDREQKLLYLLKMTGEEYINSRENYEKQLRMVQTDDMAEMRKQLRDANARIKELENSCIPSSPVESISPSDYGDESYTYSVPSAEAAPSSSNPGASYASGKNEEEFLSLKAKAALIQRILKEREAEKQENENKANAKKEINEVNQ